MNNSASRIAAHLQKLCLECGSRHCGSIGEKMSADYIESQFRAAGFTDVKREFFPTIGWEFHSFQMVDLTESCPVPGAVPCFFSRSAKVEDVPIWITKKEIPELEKMAVKGRLCIVEFFSSPADIKGRNDIAEQLDRMGAAGAVFFSDSSFHTSRHASTKIQRSPYLKTLGTAAVAEEGALYLARRKDHRYFLEINAETFDGQSCNVVARRPGKCAGKTALFGAHYDTSPLIQGAFDNASGVAALLEMAHTLKDEIPEWNLEFAAFSGEEYCANDNLPCGSAAFVKAHPELPWKFFVNFDSVGSCLGETFIATGLREKLPAFASCYEVTPVKLGGDDRPFHYNNIPSLWFNTDEPFRVFHTEGDSIEVVDPEKIAGIVGEAMKVLRQIAL